MVDIALAIREKFSSLSPSDKEVVADRANFIDLLKFLKSSDDLCFEMLIDLTAVDYKGYIEQMPERFCVVYNLYSLNLNKYFIVKVFVPESDPCIGTIVSVWAGANWPEREVFDMFGIIFKGHPDLRRILLPDSFKKNPLLKEYPLKGEGERDSFTPYYLPRET